MMRMVAKQFNEMDDALAYLAEIVLADDNGVQSQQSKVLSMLCLNEGLTSAELADYFDVDRHMVARRLPEMQGRYVEKGSVRRCEVSDRLATTWWLV